MKYYKTSDHWQNFFSYIKSNIPSSLQDRIGFKHLEDGEIQEIYIASIDDRLIEIIKKKYRIEACDQPAHYLDDRNWAYVGNVNFFPPKIR